MRQGTRMRQSTRAVREGADTHKLKCVSHKLKCVCLVQICGAVCSLRQKQDRIAVWTKDASVCAPIFPAPLLPFPPLPSPFPPLAPGITVHLFCGARPCARGGHGGMAAEERPRRTRGGHERGHQGPDVPRVLTRADGAAECAAGRRWG